MKYKIKNNVKEHPASKEDSKTNHTDGGGLDVSSCSASSLIGELEVMAKAGKLGKPTTYNPKELDALVASGKCYFSDVYTPSKNRTTHQSIPC